jgi:hypothetical protein
MAEMPILDMTLTTPLEAAFTKFLQAFLWSMPVSSSSRIMSSIVSKAT